MTQYIPSIALTDQSVGETIMITATCGQHKVSRYVRGVGLLDGRVAAIQETKLILITELALRILKEAE